MTNYSVSGINGIWLSDESGQFVAPYTPEQFIFDENGMRLKDKLANFSVSAVTSAQTDAVNDIQEKAEAAMNAISSEQKVDRDCIADLYEQLYPMHHNFTVISNSSASGCSVCYHITGRNGQEITPTTVVIKRKVNGVYDADNLFDTDSYASVPYWSIQGIPTSGAVQDFEIMVTKQGRSDVANASIMSATTTAISGAIRTYVCAYGANTASVVSDDLFSALKKVLARGLNSTPTITTHEGQYIWIIVPSELTINKVSCAGFNIPLEEAQVYNVIGHDLYNGSYKAYRSTQKLIDATWKLNIDGTLTEYALEEMDEEQRLREIKNLNIRLNNLIDGRVEYDSEDDAHSNVEDDNNAGEETGNNGEEIEMGGSAESFD